MLQNSITEPSVSPWASPDVLVRKADKTLGLCIDYRSLNKATIKDSYPLAHIQDTLNTLYGNKLFTTLDLLKGYHKIEFEESSREKTAFTTHVGLFQCICLPFGLRNVPATVTGTHSSRLHWKVCNPVHRRHTFIQQHLRRPPQSRGTVTWHYRPSEGHTSRYKSKNTSLLGILSSFWATSLPPIELDLTRRI